MGRDRERIFLGQEWEENPHGQAKCYEGRVFAGSSVEPGPRGPPGLVAASLGRREGET